MLFEQPQKQEKILGTVETTGNWPVYDPTKSVNQFSDIVIFRGATYDLREEDGSTGLYRLTSEDYFGPDPAFLRVDKSGHVIEAKTIRGKEWILPQQENEE